ncbi:hypothetical protein GTQ43_39775 [Nostoc sp. KVJ3]|nr:hypothetical protein [Nostoc sp. KVJ3]
MCKHHPNPKQCNLRSPINRHLAQWSLISRGQHDQIQIQKHGFRHWSNSSSVSRWLLRSAVLWQKQYVHHRRSCRGCRGHQLCTSKAEPATIPSRTSKNPKEKKQIMSHQDTVQTQPSLTTTEIMTIILGCEQTLRFVQASPNYKQIEASERFSTSNDLKMGDAVQALMEIHEAILNIEFYSQV